MKAKQLLHRRVVLADDVFAELLLWDVPVPVFGSRHNYKYSLALVCAGVCVLRYDNERGKGDHRHIDNIEMAYPFKDVSTLLSDFQSDMERWLNENRNA